jgi:glyoxylase-like metal-dependent hydrolase (beta-lactamase superfamily II)
MAFGVRSFKVGEVDVPGPELFWMSDWTEWHPLWFQVVLVQGDGINALVNTGLPPDPTELRDLWISILGERGTLRREREEEIENVLAAAGLVPSDITHVLLTPFQLYTTGNVTRFDNATFCFTKRGWVHYHTTHAHPHDDRWTSIARDELVYLVTDAWDRVRLLEDEDEIVPGVRTWWSGTHHRASMVVEVDSTAGTVAISDSFFYYENVEDGKILGINENMYEALRTNERVLATAAHIVPLYDPKVFERYPGGIVAQPS